MSSGRGGGSEQSRAAQAGGDDEPGGVLGGVAGEVGQDRDVGVGGEDDAGVAELVLDGPQVGACCQGEAGGAVPQVVQADRREAGGGGQFPEVPGQPVRATGSPWQVVNA
jgi:hypothetical protein